ncbi:MAG: thiamine pyrophosphate-dependent enzyme, partial [Chthoniobacterales bacterium]
TDLEACMKVVGGAIAAARAGGGPQLVVADLLRLVGHGEHDNAKYVDAALRKQHVGRDCLNVAAEAIVAHGWATAEELTAWRDEIKKEINDIATRVQREPEPDPEDEDWCAISTTRLADQIA